MDTERVEKLARLVLKDLSEYGNSEEIKRYDDLEAKIKDLMNVAIKVLPDHQELFTITYRNISKQYYGLRVSQARSIIEHLLAVLEIEKATERKLKK